MFVRRRRPLLRAAMVGGVAYHAGKRHQEEMAEDEMTEARLQQLEAQQGGAAPAPAAPAQVPVEQLKQLAELRAQGVLSEDEFEQQKRRLLQGS
jgi:hypothetical protein